MIVPAFRIHRSIRKIEWRHPVFVLLVHRMLFMYVIGNVIEQNTEPILMRYAKHFFYISFRTKSKIYSGRGNRPVAMISAKLGFWIMKLSPSVYWILGNRRDPNGIDMEVSEITTFYFLGNSLNITTVILGFG